MVAAPVLIPVTVPVALTEAIAALDVVQVPPPAASVSVMLAPIHTTEGPDIVPALAVVFTVIATDVEAVPHEVVDV